MHRKTTVIFFKCLSYVLLSSLQISLFSQCIDMKTKQSEGTTLLIKFWFSFHSNVFIAYIMMCPSVCKKTTYFQGFIDGSFPIPTFEFNCTIFVLQTPSLKAVPPFYGECFVYVLKIHFITLSSPLWFT